MTDVFDIYTQVDVPVWGVLFIQSTILPWLQALATRYDLSEVKSKQVTILLNVVIALVAVIASENGFSLVDILALAAPGILISSNSYDKVWKALGIRNLLKPESGIPL